ncbi:MAG: phosphate signaling complex protein PhoU [bacterium]|nr:phosphate signaling complex protein PhoU [bacterium]
MSRESFQNAIQELQTELIEMGEMVEQAIEQAVLSLKEKNVSIAKKVIADDILINRKRWDIEEKSLALIVTQQPVAGDLRKLISLLNIIVDLERMGDHAEGIAKITIMIGDMPHVKPLIDIPKMAQKTIDMLKRALSAFLTNDADEARQICKEDDEIDMLYEQVYRELLSFMIEDPKTITRATHLIWAAHNLERIADRITNICERVVFLVTGKMEYMDVSKY